MKLIFCVACQDIVSLRLEEMRSCSCGRVYGRYVDKIKAEVSTTAISLGIDNNSLIQALKQTQLHGSAVGYPLEAFMRPNTGPSNPNTTEIP